MNITGPSLSISGGTAVVRLRVDREGCEPREVTFKFPEAIAGRDGVAGDFVLPLTLLSAMKLGVPLDIEAPVDARLLEVLPKIQDIYAAWGYGKRIAVGATARPYEGGREGRGVACFFSGGVDSWYTVMKHRDEITDLVYVQGFDVALSDTWRRGKVLELVQRVARHLGKRLIEVETDLRETFRPMVKWDYHHGGALAAVALLAGNGFRKVFIPGTFTYADQVPLGSHPLLDPLWSTGAVDIVHDGCEASRLDKLRYIGGEALVQELLRVCWRNVGQEMNCGVCEKCLRTRICLDILDFQCATFPGLLDYRLVARMELKERWHVRYEQLRAGAVQAGKHALAEALDDALKGKYQSGVRGWLARFSSGARV